MTYAFGAWRPIEEAPHGVHVILYSPPSFFESDGLIEIALASGGERYENGFSSLWQHGRATHFMPLPKPPAAAAPETDPNDGWAWWASADDEFYTVGPCATREEAFQEAIDDEFGFTWENEEKTRYSCAFYLQEARPYNVRLATCLPPDILEYALERLWDTDRLCSEYDEDFRFECTIEQERDLRLRLEAACDAWQRDHGLVFKASTFEETRNSEFITEHRTIEQVLNPPTEEAAKSRGDA